MAGNRPKTWILVADGEHARVVVPTPRRQFRTVLTLDAAEPYRRPAELSPERQPIEPRLDPRRAAKLTFLRVLAERMNAAAIEGRFDRLVLVAPAPALGELRDGLDRGAASRLEGTLVKDIVKLTDGELAAHLEAFWRAPAEDAALA